MTAEQNYRLLQEIDANRRFMLLAYQSNPALLARAEERIRRLFDRMPESAPCSRKVVRVAHATVRGSIDEGRKTS